MNVRYEVRDKVLILQPSEALGSTAAMQMVEIALTELGRGAACVVLDCARLDSISSGGLRALLEIAKNVQRAGGRMAATNCSTRVRSTFEISRLHQIVRVHDTLDQALASLS